MYDSSCFTTSKHRQGSGGCLLDNIITGTQFGYTYRSVCAHKKSCPMQCGLKVVVVYCVWLSLSRVDEVCNNMLTLVTSSNKKKTPFSFEIRRRSERIRHACVSFFTTSYSIRIYLLIDAFFIESPPGKLKRAASNEWIIKNPRGF